jgi:hypothetical protein
MLALAGLAYQLINSTNPFCDHLGKSTYFVVPNGIFLFNPPG